MSWIDELELVTDGYSRSVPVGISDMRRLIAAARWAEARLEVISAGVESMTRDTEEDLSGLFDAEAAERAAETAYRAVRDK